MTPFLDLKLFSSVNSLYLQYNDWIYLAFIIILLVIFIWRFYPFFKSKDKSDFKSLVDYLLFKKIDYSENITSSENEDFSNYDYQEFFTLIARKYLELEENESKNLIIVLDNLDRVDDNIVLNSISLIQTTFEWIKNEKGESVFNRLIFILPIDKQRLKEVFEKLIKTQDKDKNKDKNKNEDKEIDKDNFTEWFIDKTFSVIVDIPKLEQSDWRSFFKEMMIKAFWETEINDLDIWYLISSFYSWIKNEKNKKNITPREIINYINELVSNYYFFEKEIPLLDQWIYILLKRYYIDIIKKIDDKKSNNIIDELKQNEILKRLWWDDFETLYENLLKQHFKSDQVYNLLYLDSFIEYIKAWESTEIDKILDKINSKDKINGLIEKGLNTAYENKPDISILWKIGFVIANSKHAPLIETWKNLIKKIKENMNNGIINLDSGSAKWITDLLKKHDDNDIKDKLPKNIIKEIILSNLEKKDA